MPDAARAVSGIPRTDPGGRVTLRFWHRLNRFRHFCGGSLALASLDRACRNLVPAFPQRSPPRLLTAAACGGLRSAPDCRTRRALLHLSYSCASPVLMTVLVTHDPERSWEGEICCGAQCALDAQIDSCSRKLSASTISLATSTWAVTASCSIAITQLSSLDF